MPAPALEFPMRYLLGNFGKGICKLPEGRTVCFGMVSVMWLKEDKINFVTRHTLTLHGEHSVLDLSIQQLYEPPDLHRLLHTQC